MAEFVENDLCATGSVNDLKQLVEAVMGETEIAIPKEEIQNIYNEIINNSEGWRDDLPAWREAKKMTPKEYFIHAGLEIDDDGNVIEQRERLDFNRARKRKVIGFNASETGIFESFDSKEKYVMWDFETAWETPIAWLKMVSRQHPTIAFELEYLAYFNKDFGIYTVKNGKAKKGKEKYSDYECPRCDYWDKAEECGCEEEG